MQRQAAIWDGAVRRAALALALVIAGAASAQAHHMMGNATPATFGQGLLSGFGHPIIGLDHLAFIVAMGVAVGVAGLSLALPVFFMAVSAVGVALHVGGVTLPIAELAVAASVLIAGVLIASGRALAGSLWAALFALAGLFHGYAFGEAVAGAEPMPIAAYLVGLVIVQGALSTAVALIARRGSVLPARLAGATIAGMGLAILAGQMLPA